MELLNAMAKFDDASVQGAALRQEAFKAIVLLINPFTPHLSHALWQLLGHGETLVEDSGWPLVDPSRAGSRFADLRGAGQRQASRYHRGAGLGVEGNREAGAGRTQRRRLLEPDRREGDRRARQDREYRRLMRLTARLPACRRREPDSHRMIDLLTIARSVPEPAHDPAPPC